MVLFHRNYYVKGKERNFWAYWVKHSGFGKPRFYKEYAAKGYPWECIVKGFSWGKLNIYIARNTYTRKQIKEYTLLRQM